MIIPVVNVNAPNKADKNGDVRLLWTAKHLLAFSEQGPAGKLLLLRDSLWWYREVSRYFPSR
jgi:hypothetical protein